MQDKRTHARLTSVEEVRNEFAYDVRTRMTFRFRKDQKNEESLFSGAIKNISAEGLCFVSNQHLSPGDKLEILVSLPGAAQAIKMDVEARWSAVAAPVTGETSRFDTGVRVITVDGRPVAKTVYYDEAYQVHWSIVLESVLGRFRIMQQQRRASGDNP